MPANSVKAVLRKKLNSEIRLLPKNGNAAFFGTLLTAQLLPFLLRTFLLISTANSLTRRMQGAITLVTVFLASAFLGAAILRIRELDLTLDTSFFAAVRLFISVGAALYLEIMLFRQAFPSDGLLPKNPIWLVAALLDVCLVVHTALWAVAILSERNTLIPGASLWPDTWKILLRSPLHALSQFVTALALFWAAAVLLPRLSVTLFAFLYRSVAGTCLLAVLWSLLLTPLLRLLIRLSAEIVAREFPSEAEELTQELERQSSADIAADAALAVRKNPGSGEEVLIERGLLTREEAYSRPNVVITDDDLTPARSLLADVRTPFAYVPLYALALLILLLVLSNALSRTTCVSVINGITDDAEAAAAKYTAQNNTAAAAAAYTDALADLESLDAYLGAIAGGVANKDLNEESAQVETYAQLFDYAQGYAADRSFPYLLEAKLLLKDNHPDLAVTVLRSMIDRELDTDETHLLLLQSCRQCGDTHSETYHSARRECISRRMFTDNLAYLDLVSVRDAGTISASMQDTRSAFYLAGQLALWKSYRESGEFETSYNGLRSLLEDPRYAENFDVLRSFLETGMNYHIRLDGTGDGIEDAYLFTAGQALEYDRLYTIALAAGEKVEYSLLDVKLFVGRVLISVKKYEAACNYLAEAIVRYADSEELASLYREAYSLLPESSMSDYLPYEFITVR